MGGGGGLRVGRKREVSDKLIVCVIIYTGVRTRGAGGGGGGGRAGGLSPSKRKASLHLPVIVYRH